jgi:hypothetical protein
MSWKKVEKALPFAKAIAFDDCHKIYLAMDEEQVELFKAYGYKVFMTDNVAVLEVLHEWWADSCGLRFISAVSTVEGDPNKGFVDLIAQGERA